MVSDNRRSAFWRVGLLRLLLHSLLPSSVNAETYSLQLAKIQSDCGTLYTVVPGDDCWAIAGSAGITVAQLQALNPDMECASLGVGDGVCLQLPCGRTYGVALGEWCAKIIDEQNVSMEDLLSLNPGFTCETLFPGQHLCLAPPPVDPPAGPAPPPLEEHRDPVPTVPCSMEVPVAEGDTCHDLATTHQIQLSQFTTMNANLNCSHLEAGDLACVRPACASIHMVQNGEWCGQIELSYTLDSGKLAELNPGLDCNTLAPNQVLCVEAPEEQEPWTYEPSYDPQPNFGSFSEGETVPQSPLLQLATIDDGSKTVVGKMAAQSDASHNSSFNFVDVNKDGFLDLDEIKTMARVNPSMTRGLDDVQDADDFAAQMLDNSDTDHDGKISREEFMFAVTQARHASTELGTARIERRVLPLLLLFGLLAAASIASIVSELKLNAKLREQQILNHMDVLFWDRESGDPEPKCAVYVYYSTSCAALGHHWSSHCSEGGEKVFGDSCVVPFAPGALGCGFLGCSSMCYKVNTDNCDCNCLKFTSEDGYYYNDNAHSETIETGISPCRTKCANLNGCTGFSISPGTRSNNIRCKIFNGPMTNRVKRDQTASYKAVGGSIGATDPQPRPPFQYSAGLTRKTLEEILMEEMMGRWVSDAYAQHRSLRRRELAVNNSSYLSPRAPIPGSAPNEYDWRTTYPTTIKDQGRTGTCVSQAFVTMVEAAVKKQFQRTTNKDLSASWVHYCRTKLELKNGMNSRTLRNGVGDSYLATESCRPFDQDTNPVCRPNNCGASQYHDMPYVTRWQEFPTPSWWHRWRQGSAVDPSIIHRMQEWIASESPLHMIFNLHEGFTDDYLDDLENSSEELVFYDDHPRYSRKNTGWSGHAMAVVGYKHHIRPAETIERLVWIVQNSWGSSAGKNGFVFIEVGSLGNTLNDISYGVNVKEGHYWFATQLPSNR